MSYNVKPNCLVVEPEMGMRDFLVDLLEENYIKVKTTSTDAEAVRLLKKKEGEDINIVICPAPPPGAKHSLPAKIRASSRPLLPVVCLSHQSSLEDIAQAFGQGGSEYILKPFAPEYLLEKISFWAGRDHKPK